MLAGVLEILWEEGIEQRIPIVCKLLPRISKWTQVFKTYPIPIVAQQNHTRQAFQHQLLSY